MRGAFVRLPLGTAVAVPASVVTAAALALPSSVEVRTVPLPVVASVAAVVVSAFGLVIVERLAATHRVAGTFAAVLPRLGLLAAAIVAVWGWWACLADDAAGFPSVRAPVLAVAATAAAVGFVVAIREWQHVPADGDPVPIVARLRRQWLPLGVLALVVAASVSYPFVRPAAWTERGGGSLTTDRVDRPSTVAWQRQFPDLIDAVAVADGGVVVVRRPGVVEAIDGATGRTRWTYTRRRAPATTKRGAARVSPDGRTVVVPFGRGSSPRSTSMYVVLDGRTGEQRWTLPATKLLYAVTDNAVVLRDHRHRSGAIPVLTGYDGRDGRRRWAWRGTEIGPRCGIGDTAPAALADRLAVSTICPNDNGRRAVVALLSDRDGRPQARLDYDLGGPRSGLDYVGNGVALEGTGQRLVVGIIPMGGDRSVHLVDALTGRETAVLDTAHHVLINVGATGLLWWDNTAERDNSGPRMNAISDPSGGGRVVLPGVPNGACGDTRPVWTRTHLVTLCTGTDRPVRVVTTRLDGTTDGQFDLPAPVGEADRPGRRWQQVVQFVDTGGGFATRGDSPPVVVDEAHKVLLGLR
ncbi:outer membrane protein assembly factor BamB family protein [Virgisporangium aliadipatigenens]|uniref:outer membrane protein assembly factor BamB family protein n=1 Tax=Virgisporangium aliadipatigenens TaxID=741659 RepID=UPI0019435975|nr:PQQ-binding-like beta-propeller repeat protein [Virgisporangium aliadipatigenens]